MKCIPLFVTAGGLSPQETCEVRAYHLYCKIRHLIVTQLVRKLMVHSLDSQPRLHNMFTLIRSPTQTTFDQHGTNLPIAPFTTGYAAAEPKTVQKLVETSTWRTNLHTGIDTGSVALLDNRSMLDNTVTLCMTVPRNIEAVRDGIEEEESSEWKWWEWRIVF